MRRWHAMLLVLVACGAEPALVVSLDASVDTSSEDVVDAPTSTAIDAGADADADDERSLFPYHPGRDHCGACPVNLPEAGSACTRRSLECEYGDHPDFRCNARVVCEGPWPWDGGTWKNVNGSCTTPLTCAPPVMGGVCLQAENNAACSSMGTVCATDAGFCVCGYSGFPYWTCTPSCATPRPRMGCDCDPKKFCVDYQTPPEVLQCKDGIVQYAGCIAPP